MGRTTSITIGDNFGPFIERLIASGRYGSVSDIVRAGLRQLQLAEFRMARLQRFLDTCPVDDEPLTPEEIAERDREDEEDRPEDWVPSEVVMARLFPDAFDVEGEIVELERAWAGPR